MHVGPSLRIWRRLGIKREMAGHDLKTATVCRTLITHDSKYYSEYN